MMAVRFVPDVAQRSGVITQPYVYRHCTVGNAWVRRVQSIVTIQALSAAYASQGIKRTAGSHPSEAYAADKAEYLANGLGQWNYRIIQVCAKAHGRPPDTLSLGWLPAVRFIPAERVSGELPPTVDLRSPFFCMMGLCLSDQI